VNKLIAILPKPLRIGVQLFLSVQSSWFTFAVSLISIKMEVTKKGIAY